MEGPKNIFWGLVVKPGKRYDTVVQEAFRVTKACIEPGSVGSKISSVFVECDNSEEFIVANLGPKIFNETLDLAFNEGEKICFKVDGPGTIHLTGNILEDSAPNNDDSMFDMMDSGESSEESSEEEESDVEAGDKIQEVTDEEAQKVKGVKRKKEEKSKEQAKKAKVDNDSTIDTTMDTTVGDLDSTENFAEEEDSDDDEDSSDEEGDSTLDPADTTGNVEESDESSDDDDSDEEEEEKPVVKKENDKVEKTPKAEKTTKADKTPKIEKESQKPEAKTPKEKKALDTPKQTKKSENGANIETQETPKSKKQKINSAELTPKQEEVVKTPKVKENGDVQNEKAVKTPKEKKDKTPKPDTPAKELKTPNKDVKVKAENTPGKTPKRTLKGGIVTEELKEGNGPECKPGNMVGMYYSGKLKKNGKQFDATLSGKPFKFKLGAGQVIKGWDVGVLGMKVGGKRRLTVPAPMAYGAQGAPPDIPANSDLIFDVECKFVK